MVPCIKLKSNVVKTQYCKKIIYQYSKLNKEKFIQELIHADLENTVNTNTVEEAATKLSEHILEAAKRVMPIKTVSMKQKQSPMDK